MHFDLLLLSAIFISAGLAHFIKARLFERIVPTYLPWPKTLVFISGIAEVALGIGLLISSIRSVAAWGLIILLIAVFPANVEMLRRKRARLGLPQWLLILRLPLQVVLIYWAWLYT